MEVTFNDPELTALYEGEPVKRKELKSNATLSKQFVKTINQLKGVDKVEQLMQIKALDYKKLTDDPDGMSAVWINKQFRLHFLEIVNNENPPKVVLLQIEKITNHYK